MFGINMRGKPTNLIPLINEVALGKKDILFYMGMTTILQITGKEIIYICLLKVVYPR